MRRRRAIHLLRHGAGGWPEGRQSFRSIHEQFISQVFVGYNFNDWLGVQFQSAGHLPFLQTPGRHGRQRNGSETGIGDVSLLGTLTPYQKLTDNSRSN